MSVVVSVSKPPSARDVEIYSRLVQEQALQAAVANEFGLSQSAVSKIYRRVAEYLAENGSGEWQFAEDAAFFAHHDYVEQVNAAVGRVHGLFEQSTESRPNCALINTYLRSCKTLRDARVEAAKVGCLRAEAIKSDPRRLEEWLVRQAEQMCRDLRDHVKQQARCGLAAMNLPHDTKQDRQAHVRNTFRTTKSDDPLSLLPPAWQRAYKLAFLETEESLGGTGVSPVSSRSFGGSTASEGMADSSVSDGGSTSDSALPHPAGEGTGKMPAPPPASEKMEYETAEKPSFSDAPAVVTSNVTNDKPGTYGSSSASDSTTESTSIPRNILGGSSVSRVPLPRSISNGDLVFDEQTACDAISAALTRRQRQRRLATARRK
jgi:hypothetical protein